MHKKLSLGIQSLKGIAAIMVFLSHSLHQFPNKTIETLHDSCLHFFFDGQIAVIIFMAISGFFYYKPNEKINFKGYICKIEKKVSRIYTPYIIVMICAFVALIYFPTVDSSRYTEWAGQFWTHSVTIKQLLYQLTILFMGDANILNPPIWYLKCEIEMFLVMPIVAYLFQKNKKWTFLSFFILFFLFRGYAIIYLLGMLTHYLILEYPKVTQVFSKKGNQIPLVCLSIAMLNIFNELSISHLGMSRFSCLLYERTCWLN